MPKNQPLPITIYEARKILGTTAKGLDDSAIENLLKQFNILSDIVVAHTNDSRFQSSIDISKNELHTEC